MLSKQDQGEIVKDEFHPMLREKMLANHSHWMAETQ